MSSKWIDRKEETHRAVLKNRIKNILKEVMEKFEKRDDRNKYRVNITDEGVKPSDIGMKDLVEHFREEVEELEVKIHFLDLNGIKDETIDVIAMCVLLNWLADEQETD